MSEETNETQMEKTVRGIILMLSSLEKHQLVDVIRVLKIPEDERVLSEETWGSVVAKIIQFIGHYCMGETPEDRRLAILREWEVRIKDTRDHNTSYNEVDDTICQGTIHKDMSGSTQLDGGKEEVGGVAKQKIDKSSVNALPIKTENDSCRLSAGKPDPRSRDHTAFQTMSDDSHRGRMQQFETVDATAKDASEDDLPNCNDMLVCSRKVHLDQPDASDYFEELSICFQQPGETLVKYVCKVITLRNLTLRMAANQSDKCCQYIKKTVDAKARLALRCGIPSDYARLELATYLPRGVELDTWGILRAAHRVQKEDRKRQKIMLALEMSESYAGGRKDDELRGMTVPHQTAKPVKSRPTRPYGCRDCVREGLRDCNHCFICRSTDHIKIDCDQRRKRK